MEGAEEAWELFLMRGNLLGITFPDPNGWQE